MRTLTPLDFDPNDKHPEASKRWPWVMLAIALLGHALLFGLLWLVKSHLPTP